MDHRTAMTAMRAVRTAFARLRPNDQHCCDIRPPVDDRWAAENGWSIDIDGDTYHTSSEVFAYLAGLLIPASVSSNPSAPS